MLQLNIDKPETLLGLLYCAQDPVWQMERAIVSKLLADGPQPLQALQSMDLFIPPFLTKFQCDSKVGAFLHRGVAADLLRALLAPHLLPMRACSAGPARGVEQL